MLFKVTFPLIVVSLFLVVSEVALRVVGYPRPTAYIDTWVNDQSTVRIQSAIERMEAGEFNHFWLPVTPQSATFATKVGDPLILSGHRNALITYGAEDDGTIYFKSDRNGFRNPPDSYDASTLDVLALGDSYTQGCCVADGGSFVDVLRSRTGWAVYNGGWSATGALYSLAVYAEYGRVKEPRVVLLTLAENLALSRTVRESKLNSFAAYLIDLTPRLAGLSPERQTELVERQTAYQSAVAIADLRSELAVAYERLNGGLPSAAKILAKKSRIVELLNQVLARYGLHMYGRYKDFDHCQMSTSDQSAAVFRSVLHALVDAQAKHNGKVLIAYVPRSGLSGTPRVACDLPVIQAAAREVGVPVIDLYDTLASQPAEIVPQAFGHDQRMGHFTVAGYTLIGETLAQALSPFVPPRQR